jgi:hypothetical protein
LVIWQRYAQRGLHVPFEDAEPIGAAAILGLRKIVDGGRAAENALFGRI